MSTKWFNWYTAKVGKNKKWAKFHGRFLCPCCYMPTLTERADFEICPICFWEDDGQDSDDADVIRGGSNHGYSLSEARQNFQKYHTMYRSSDRSHFEREMKNMEFKKKIYLAYQQAIRTNTEEDWQCAISEEGKYYDRDV